MGTTYVEQAEELEEVSPGHHHPSPHMQWQQDLRSAGRSCYREGRTGVWNHPEVSTKLQVPLEKEATGAGGGGTHRSGGGDHLLCLGIR